MSDSQNQDRPLILLTNDDGFDSPGILELAKYINEIGDVLLVAPKEHQSGTARGIPFGALARSSGIIEEHKQQIDDDLELLTYAVHGTPAQCSVHAVVELAHRKPDLCISGINFGENIGRALNYSGTIGAAIEAADFGIPSFGISQQLSYEDMFGMQSGRAAFTDAAKIATAVAKQLLDNPPKQDFFCLNVNVPHGATLDTQFEITKQSDVNRWAWVMDVGPRDFSQNTTLAYEEVDDAQWITGTDAHCVLVNKNISITPLSWAIDARENEYDYSELGKLVI